MADRCMNYQASKNEYPASMRIWHVSDRADITLFEPRLPPSADAAVADRVVWGVDDSHLVNYLFSRECPRIAIRRGPDYREEDADRFLGPGSADVVLFATSAQAGRAR